jgi:putative transposase
MSLINEKGKAMEDDTLTTFLKIYTRSETSCWVISTEHIRSDNGPEFTAQAISTWLNKIGIKTLFIEPGSPWENGYIESFNGKLRDEILNREIFTTLNEAKVLIEQWRQEYNQIRPHSSLGYQPPAPEVIMSGIVT